MFFRNRSTLLASTGLLLSLLASLPVYAQQPGTIDTIAGSGPVTSNEPFSGEGGPATAARITGARNPVIDKKGEIYFRHAGSIRKIDRNGIIWTVAGEDNPPDGALRVSGGDGGPVNLAHFEELLDLAFDPQGQLFIADRGRVRKVDLQGIVTTVVGGGTETPQAGIPATGAQLTYVTAVTFDSAGTLYLASMHMIYKVGADGLLTYVAGAPGEKGEFAGDGGPAAQARFNYVSDLAVDGAGNLLIADLGNQRVRKIDAAGTVSTIAGNPELNPDFGNYKEGFSGDGGPATQAQFASPSSVSVDSAGNIFINDSGNFRIRRISPNGIVDTVAGKTVPLTFPFDETNYFSGDGGPATDAALNNPSGTAIDRSGNLLIADSANNRIRMVYGAASTGMVAGAILPATPETDTAPPAVWAIVHGETVEGQYAARVDMSSYDFNPGVKEITYSATGAQPLPPTTVNGSRFDLRLTAPGDTIVTFTATDLNGNTSAPRTLSAHVPLPGETGIITTLAGSVTERDSNTNLLPGDFGDGGLGAYARLEYPTDVALDANDNIHITTGGKSRTRKLSSDGIISAFAGGNLPFYNDGFPATQVPLSGRDPVADGVGNVYLASGNKIYRIDPQGIITHFAGRTITSDAVDGLTGAEVPALNAAFAPGGLAFDKNGNLYVADGYNRVRKISTDGTVTTVAGSGTVSWQYDAIQSEAGYAGDGGPATQAKLDNPSGIALDLQGNIYILDAGNYRIRKIDTNGIITTVAGAGPAGSLANRPSWVSDGDGGPALSAHFADPRGIAVDSAGNLFVTDKNQIRKIDPNGIVTTVAGNGATRPIPTDPRHRNGDYSGDGGPATQAALDHPWGLAIDRAGNLIFADYMNQRVRMVSKVASPGLLAGDLFPPADSPAGAVKGDVNRDGKINLQDAINILQALVGLIQLADVQKTAADVNGNGLTDVLDVVFLLRNLIQIEPDNAPPVTQVSAYGEKNSQGVYTSGVSIYVTAADANSGVKEIVYEMSGAHEVPLTRVTGKTAIELPYLSRTGETTITYYAIDNAGNAESVKTLTVKVNRG